MARNDRQQRVRYPIDRRRALIALAAGGLLLVAGVGSVLALALRDRGPSAPAGPRAVIIDQLAITDPNPGFVETAAKDLQSAGYTVDYVPENGVTVDFYRDLPKRGYSFILVRSHTSDFQGSLDPAAAASATPVTSIGLFTNELYSRQTHLDDQYAQRLLVDAYADRPIKSKYFGITPAFIRESAKGRFPSSVVVLMGCSGLEANDLAQAFLAKGATQFVSWDKSVTAEHTDKATAELLADFFGKRMDMRAAVAETMRTVGADPAFGARLAVFP